MRTGEANVPQREGIGCGEGRWGMRPHANPFSFLTWEVWYGRYGVLRLNGRFGAKLYGC
jgi:hypothetical protein